MKPKTTCLSVFVVIGLAVVPASAQHMGGGGGHMGGGHHGGSGGVAGRTGPGPGLGVGHVTLPPGWGFPPAPGFGNVNHPGGVVVGTGVFPPSGIQQLMGPVVPPLISFPGIRTGVAFPPGFRRHRHFVGFVAVPVGVPLGFGYVPQQPTVIVIEQGASEVQPSMAETAPGPWAPSVIYSYEAPRPPAEPPTAGPLTLLVFKNHSIYAVNEYWVEGDRLHYVTSYGAHNSVTLDQLDLEFTIRLNAERNIKFDLKKEQ